MKIWLCRLMAIMLFVGTITNVSLAGIAYAGQYDTDLDAQVLPGDIVIDDNAGAAYVTRSGTWDSISEANRAYGSSSLYAPASRPDGIYVQYTPKGTKALAPGGYDVYMSYKRSTSWSSNVPVDIFHNDETHTVIVNQQVNGNENWFKVGSFYFTGDGTEYVRIRKETAAGYTIADAIRFSRNDSIPVPPNVKLSDLQLSSGPLTPVFQPSVLSYTGTVGSSVDQVSITPVAADPGSVSLSLNGAPVQSGQAYPVTLNPGENELAVTVASLADPSYTRTYSLVVTRTEEVSSNSKLLSLAVNPGTLDPVFQANVTEYNVNVGNIVQAIDITPTVSSSVYKNLTVAGTSTVSGSVYTVPLAVGVNDIPIVVTAENDSTTTYTLHVTRAASASSDAALSALWINAGTISFSPEVTDYDVSVSSMTNALEVTPVARSSSYASLLVNGVPKASGSMSSVALAQGENLITIGVTAEDTLTKKTYTLRVTKPATSGEIVGNAGIVNSLVASRINQAVMLYVGHNEAYTDNIRTAIDMNNREIRPFKQGSLTYVPLPYTAQGLGAQVSRTQGGGVLEAVYGGTTFVFTEGSAQITANGQPRAIPAPVLSREGQLFASAETIADVFQKSLFQDARGLTIFSGTPDLFTLPADAALVDEIVNGFAYEWGNVKIYPGGFVTGMVIHPTEPELKYARTDVGGAYRWNPDSQEWVPLMESFGLNELNLMGIDGIAVSRTEPDIVYVAAGMYGNKPNDPHDVLKSTDRGQTWQRTNLNKRFYGNSTGSAGDQRLDGERIQVDPYNADIVYVGTRYDGLWRSLDGGENWQQITAIPLGTAPAGVTNVEFDYSAGAVDGRAKVIYIGVEGSGVYKSGDGGGSWQPIVPDLEAGPKYPRRMAVSSDGTMYVSSITGLNRNDLSVTTAPTNGVFKYKDGAWTNITPAASKNQPFGPIAVNPANPDLVVAVEGYYRSSKVYVSTDAGLTWVLRGNSYGASSQFLFDPHHPEELYDLHGAGIHKTLNIDSQAIAWAAAGDGIEELCATKMLSLPDGTLIMGTLDRGGFTSTDITVPAVRLTPEASENTAFDFSEGDPNYVFRLMSSSAGTTARAAYSIDGGKTWIERSTPFPYGIGGSVAVSATKQANGLPLVVIWTNGHTPKLSRDFGLTWEDTVFEGVAAPIYTGTHFTSRRYGLEADRVTGDTFYLYDTVNGKFYTSTNGKNWRIESAATLPTNEASVIAGVRAAPYVAGEVWASANKGGLYRSIDYGKNFTKLENVQEARLFSFGKNKPGQTNPSAYVYGRINNITGIFRSDDMGATWTRINHDAYQIADDPKSMVGDRKVYGKVYVGTGGRGIYYGQLLATDDIPPKVTVEQIGSSSVKDADYAVRDAQYAVSGTLSEDATLYINGTAYSGIAKGSFSKSVQLVEGLNTISIKATDSAGNESVPVVLSVRYDPAYVGITLEKTPSRTNQASYTVTGRINTPAVVRVNGQEAAVDQNLTFSKEIALQEGVAQLVEVTAANVLGQSAEPAAFTIVLDSAAPAIQVAAQTVTTDRAYYLLRGSVSKEATVTVSGDAAWQNEDLTFERLLFLQPGLNNYLVEAVDEAGNTAVPLDIAITYELPDEQVIPKIQSAHTGNTVIVDGALSEEDWDISHIMGKPLLNTPNNITFFGTMWDETNLYVGFRVKDKQLVNHPSTVYQGDCLEVYVSPTDNRDNTYATSDKQLMFGIDWDIVMVGGNKSREGIQFARQKTDEGYTMEIMIPWANLNTTAELGKIIGFDVDNIDNDGNNINGNRDSIIAWNGTMDNYRNPQGFGRLELTSGGESEPELSNDATLSAISLSAGTISFDPAVTEYSVTVGNGTATLDVKATAASGVYKSLTVNGQAVLSGEPVQVNLVVGENTIPIVVTAEDGVTVKTYTLTVTRQGASEPEPEPDYVPSPSSSAPSSPASQGTLKDGIIQLKPETDAKTGTAKAKLEESLLKKALEQAKPDAKGVQRVEVVIDPAAGAASYEVGLPVKALDGLDAKDKLTVKTEYATVELPAGPLAGLSSAQELALAVRKGEQAGRPAVTLDLQANGASVKQPLGAAVKVSIPYTPAAAEKAKAEHLVILKKDAVGKLSPVPSGRYDAATGTVIFETGSLAGDSYVVSFVEKSFADMSGYSWAQREVQVLASKGIVNGTTETTFTPQAEITRADYLLLLIHTLGLQAEVKGNFADVDKGAYYYEAVGIAKALGISTGIGNDRFAPGASITRQEMMTLAARAMKLADKLEDAGTAADLADFEDAAEVASYAANEIAAMVRGNVIQGSDGKLHPLDTASRAEAAAMLYRIYNK
ncbi:cadherin-like beta sandwich domain-containing protein [Paenibacillus sp. YN15]|uniref:cadherin-like beta sandwich domain-containing protein n=1 Tax=Paenibacillus sp. YN15 TaxID=1742774 RepID=UPI000DCC36A4|nr:cadherin-like beta sandwich domain-containing protein [Paenibacillus sp. YN15]RAU95724.1 hypothetical protein DQG13_21700 [Paenibacillus sp. YN15]